MEMRKKVCLLSVVFIAFIYIHTNIILFTHQIHTNLNDTTLLDIGSIDANRIIMTSSDSGFTSINNNEYFNLPSSLQIIEDSAFEGTALISVDLPKSVTYIGDNAFANIPTLLAVQIPDTTQFIGKNTFTNSTHVTLTVPTNSYARTWAKDNGFRFQLLVTFNASNGPVTYSFQRDPGFRPSQKERTETTDNQGTNNIRERRTGRTIGELKASRYKGIAAMHIQSRYFP